MAKSIIKLNDMVFQPYLNVNNQTIHLETFSVYLVTMQYSGYQTIAYVTTRSENCAIDYVVQNPHNRIVTNGLNLSFESDYGSRSCVTKVGGI